MDYVTPSGVIWDWKTASRQYNIKEKQKSSIQASVYADACVNLGLSPSYPVDFRFGVMVRQEKPKSQIVSIVRTEAHGQWLRQFIKGLLWRLPNALIALALDGTSSPAPVMSSK